MKQCNQVTTCKTCGTCVEFFEQSKQCGNPMVYLNHGDNTHPTTADTPACGFYFQIKEVKVEPC